MNGLMIFPEISQEEFDYNSLLKGNDEYQLLCGIKVKIDKIIRDVTKTTVVGISGTFVLRGVRLRAVWDMYGNALECKKIISLNIPLYLSTSIDTLFDNISRDMLRLVCIEQVNK